MNFFKNLLVKLGLSSKEMTALTDDILLKIFAHLDCGSLVKAGQVCSQWRRIAWDNSLWRRFALERWPVKDSLPEGVCWRDEVERLHRRIPNKLSDMLTLHGSDVITQIAVAPDGRHFAVLTMDGWIAIWNLSSPCTLNKVLRLEPAGVGITLSMSFNGDGSLLLVSGTNLAAVAGRHRRRNTFVALVFNVPALRLVTAVQCYPQIMYSAWLNNDSFIFSALERDADTVGIHMFEVSEDRQREHIDLTGPLQFADTSRTCLLSLKPSCPCKHSNLQTARVVKSDGTANTYLLFCTGFQRKVAIYDVTEQVLDPDAKPKEEKDVHACYEKEDIFITGLSMSADQRYVIIGYRPTKSGQNTTFMPQLGVCLYDLQTMTALKESYCVDIGRAEKPMRSLWPRSSNNYIASGCEESKAFLWDRHHEFGLVTFKQLHGEGANTIVICTHDEEIILTASNIRIRVYRSHNRMKTLGLTGCNHSEIYSMPLNLLGPD